MSKYRQSLPQLADRIFLTDGGLETVFIFHKGIDLPHFASFPLLDTADGRNALREYYEDYARIAVESGSGFILESPTWRANPDWANKLGYDRQRLAAVNRDSIALLEDIREQYADQSVDIVISGNIGPRGDGYIAGTLMSEEQATDYHLEQISAFAETNVDVVTAITLTYAEEAIGVTRAAQMMDLPVVISFTTETDGRLPSGQSLRAAIEQVDAATNSGPAYFMVNCAHTEHFAHVLAEEASWTQRIRGIRANASRCSHAELDEATELDEGDPIEFGELYRSLRERLPKLSVLGGCCGTDHRHILAVSAALGD